MGLIAKSVYWLFGDRGGRVVTGCWNYLMSTPTEGGGQVAVAVAEQSLGDMQKSVQSLTDAIAVQWGAYLQAKKLVEGKQAEHDTAMRDATSAHRSGNFDAAKRMMAQVMSIEEILPALHDSLGKAEKAVTKSRDRLQDQQDKIENYKSKLKNMKDMAEINKALEAVNAATSAYNVDSAVNQFDQAAAAVDKRTLKVEAQTLLGENPNETAMRDAKRLTAGEELERRMALLDAPPEQKLLGS